MKRMVPIEKAKRQRESLSFHFSSQPWIAMHRVKVLLLAFFFTLVSLMFPTAQALFPNFFPPYNTPKLTDVGAKLLDQNELITCFESGVEPELCFSSGVNNNDYAEIDELEQDLKQVSTAENILDKKEEDDSSDDEQLRYSNHWAIRSNSGIKNIRELAANMGYVFVGQINGMDDTYLLRLPSQISRAKRGTPHVTKRLANDQRILWAEQQVIRKRSKRNEKIPEFSFNDPFYPLQWYLQDTRDMTDLPELDHHIPAVWAAGYTGKGISITVVDDGLEWTHKDLNRNYDSQLSFDFNDFDNDPMPRSSEKNNHGTRCAGEIAMVANNNICGVGIAFNAKIGGIRLLDGDVFDALEGSSLSYRNDIVDIYSVSWGPSDNGITVDAPRTLTLHALQRGVHEGRDGKGVLFVWATGNGGTKGDSCAFDGYTNSIYTLSVGSANHRGKFPYFGEKCGATLTVTYSSGAYSDQKVMTTDVNGACTISHTGTSASAPIAVGIFALILEANPNITWRDAQHLVAFTSDFLPLSRNRGWKQNGAGFVYNSRFGFGLMNAKKLLTAALNWTNVPEKTTCVIRPTDASNVPSNIVGGSDVRIMFDASKCSNIRSTEHVTIVVNISYPIRGHLDAYLVSPAGTVSMLLYRRPKDISPSGFKNFQTMSVHFWGEAANGTWNFVVRDVTRENRNEGKLNSAVLTIHGMEKIPEYQHQRFRNPPNLDLKNVLDPQPEYEYEQQVANNRLSSFTRNAILLT